MTERFALLLALGAIPLFFVGSYPTAFVFLTLYNSMAVALFMADRRAIGAPLLEVVRDHRTSWRLGRVEPLVLTLTSRAPVPLLLDVREDLPEGVEEGGVTVAEASPDVGLEDAEDLALIALGMSTGGLSGGESGGRDRFRTESQDFDEDDEYHDLISARETTLDVPFRSIDLDMPPAMVPLRVEIPPSSALRLRYTLTPRVQGSLRLGHVHYRLHGLLGFAYVQGKVEISEIIEVSAPLTDDGRLSRATRPSVGDQGAVPSRKRGSGVELESLRPYTAGDTFRKINWKASARRGKVIVRETIDEVDRQVIIMVDGSRLMGVEMVVPETDSGSPLIRGSSKRSGETSVPGVRMGPVTRLELAVRTAQLMSDAALKQNDKVGLWVFADEVLEFVKPGRGRRHRVHLGKVLQSVAPGERVGSLENAVAHLSIHVRRRSSVIVITEPPPDLEPWVKAVKQLASRHRVQVISLADPELGISLSQPSQGPESALRRSAAADMTVLRDVTRSRLADEGVPIVQVDPTQLTLQSLASLLK